MLDETQFLSGQGVRSLSKFHEQHPFYFETGGRLTKSATGQRNPTAACSAAIPTGAADLDADQFPDHRVSAKISLLYGNDFKVECRLVRENS